MHNPSHHPPLESRYRSSVVGVFINDHGEVLVLERTDTPHAWQFPQGGIEPGESPKQALVREMHEELGNPEFVCLKQSSQRVCYDFPASLAHTAIAQQYTGQSALWFLCQYYQGGPQLESATTKEFQDFKWIQPTQVVAATVTWKQSAYQQGLKLLELIPPSS